MTAETRYSRQTMLPEIGTAGQRRLARSKVLFVGAGGLGCAALPYLAAAGVGRITVVDDDRVARENLHRQVLYRESDLGRSKAEAAVERLRHLNTGVEVVAVPARLDSANIVELYKTHDFIADGSDNYPTKYLLGDAAVKYGRPLVYASATGMEGMVTVFDSKRGPCLRCLFPQPPAGFVPNCAAAGVLGPLVGILGCLQAAEIIKWLAAGPDASWLETLAGRLWLLDARDMRVRQLQITRRADCQTCAKPSAAIRLPTRNLARAAEIEPQEAAALADALYVDVREPEEYAVGHIPNAFNLPLSRLEQSAPGLPAALHYIVYCARGARSQRAAEILKDRGISGILCLRGGFESWRSASA